MRFIIYGAGAVGGVVGARLAQHGHDVALIARGAHLDAIRSNGLQFESPDETLTLPLRAEAAPAALVPTADDVVLLAMKTQHTAEAIERLYECAPPGIGVVCLQNGVENERQALRRFAGVYGVSVMCPTTHLVPGVVQANASPITGILDLGRYPSGIDARADAIAAALGGSTFISETVADIARWKHAKLLLNLTNAIEVLCGSEARAGEVARRAKEEGVACFEAAGIAFASDAEDQARRGDFLRLKPIRGERRGGSSSWQSVVRGTGTIETAYLNGEIVLLGRLHGVPTPVNSLLCGLTSSLARSGGAPGSVAESELLAQLAAG